MTEAVATQPQKTDAELLQALQNALSAGDFAIVAEAAAAVAKRQAQNEAAANALRQEEIAKLLPEVLDAINAVVKPMMDAGDLDVADGIWYSWDFGETGPTLRMSSKAIPAPRAPSTGGGGNTRRFDESTESLVGRMGTFVNSKGVTYRDLYSNIKGDPDMTAKAKNAAIYATVRVPLLAADARVKKG